MTLETEAHEYGKFRTSGLYVLVHFYAIAVICKNPFLILGKLLRTLRPTDVSVRNYVSIEEGNRHSERFVRIFHDDYIVVTSRLHLSTSAGSL